MNNVHVVCSGMHSITCIVRSYGFRTNVSQKILPPEDF